MNNATDRFYILDEELNIVTVNDTSLKKYGFSRQQMVGRNFFDVFPRIRGTGRREEYERVLKTGERYSTVDMSDPDDQYRLLAFRIEGGMGLISTDVTEIMAYQNQLEALHVSDVVHTERLKRLHVYTQIVGQAKGVEDLIECTLDAMESLFDVGEYDFIVVINNTLRTCGVRGLDVPSSSLLDFSDKGIARALLRGRDVEIDVPSGGRPLDGQGVTVRAINQNRSQLVNDVREDPEYVSFIEEEFERSDPIPYLSELATPIFVDETPFGVLNLESSKLNAFNQQDLEVLEVLAGQLAVTLKRMKLEERMKELHTYIQNLSKANTIEDLVESTIETMESVFEIVVCNFLVILDNRLQSIATKGPELPPLKELRVDGRGFSEAFFPSVPMSSSVSIDMGLNLEGAGICARAIRERETQLIGDIRKDPDYVVYHTPTFEFFKEKGIEVLSELAVPIIVDGMPFGVINLESGKLNGYSQQDLELMEILANQVGIVVSNMRVFNATTRKLMRSQEQYSVLSDNLHTHAQRLAVVNDLDEIARITKDAVKEILGFTRVGLGIVERDGLRYHSVEAPTVSNSIPLDGPGITIRAVKSGETQLVPDTEKDPDFITLRVEGAKTRSELVVPIKIEGQIVGVLDLASESVGAFNEQHAKVVEIFSSQVASALNRSRTRELESSRSRLMAYQNQLEALHNSSSRLAEADNLEEIAETTIETLSKTLGHGFGEIGFIEDDRFVFYASTRREYGEKPSIPLESKSVIVRSIKAGEPQLVPDVREDPDYRIMNPAETPLLSELSYPILVDDRVVGALNVESPERDAFSQDDVRLMGTLAQHVASSVRRLEQIDRLETYQSRLEALHVSSTRLVQADDLQEITAITVETMYQALGHAIGEIGFVEGDSLVMYGNTQKEITGRPSIPLDSKSIMVRTIKTRDIQLVPDVSEDPDYTVLYIPTEGFSAKSELCIPILVDDRAVGALNVESLEKDAFTQDDVRLLETLAQSVSSAFSRFQAESILRESETRYRSLYENSLEGILVSSDENILSINPTGAEIFGAKGIDEMVGMPAVELYTNPEDRIKLFEILGNQGYVKDYEITFKKLDGSHTIASCNVTVHTNEKGEVQRVETFFRDITEQKRMGEDLRRNQALLESFMSNATDRFYILDGDLNILSVNDAVLERFEFERKKILGKNITELFPQETGRIEEYQRVLETGELYTSIDTSRPENKFKISAFQIEDGIGIIATEITDLLNYQSRLEALHDSATRLEMADSVQEIDAITIEVLGKVLGYTWGGIGFVEGDRFAFHDTINWDFPDGFGIPLDSKSIIVRTIKTGVTQLIDDITEDPDYFPVPQFELQDILRSELAVPIKIVDEVVGVLNVEGLEKGIFTQTDASLLETLAQHVASAVRRVREEGIRAQQFIELTYKLNNLEPGASYISESHDRCFKVFAELSLHGVSGMCFVRDDPEMLVNKYGFKTENLMLLSSRSIKGFEALNNLQDISRTISSLLKEGSSPVILLDGIEYMISLFGFDIVYSFLQEKKFDILEADAILLVPIDILTLDERQKALLSSEMKTLT